MGREPEGQRGRLGVVVLRLEGMLGGVVLAPVALEQAVRHAGRCSPSRGLQKRQQGMLGGVVLHLVVLDQAVKHAGRCSAPKGL